jgi:RecQ family ATP-dependent DNA helicase
MDEKIKLLLKSRFSFTSFRFGQEEIIKNVINKKDCLILMPTGGGKSLCYQLPGIYDEGTTIVISPLISLMYDQVTNLVNMNIKACYINSNTTYEDKQKIYNTYDYKFIYTTPETILLNSQFNDYLEGLHKSNKLERFVIDEAHCVSTWGHDFRESYLKLHILKETYKDISIVCFTATATQMVQLDIISQLRLKMPYIKTQTFIRRNISYNLISEKPTNNTLSDILDEFPNQTGIIYCFSRKQCETTAKSLKLMGYSAEFYHANIDYDEKQRIQSEWYNDKTKIIIATIAFGLGIDKPNVRFIIHLSMPKNIESYYQETGRAGRDGLHSKCILFYTMQDLVKLKSMINSNNSTETIKNTNINNLHKMFDFCQNKIDCRKNQISLYLGDFTFYTCRKDSSNNNKDSSNNNKDSSNSGDTHNSCDNCLNQLSKKNHEICLNNIVTNLKANTVITKPNLVNIIYDHIPNEISLNYRRMMNDRIIYALILNRIIDLKYTLKSDKTIITTVLIHGSTNDSLDDNKLSLNLSLLVDPDSINKAELCSNDTSNQLVLDLSLCETYNSIYDNLKEIRSKIARAHNKKEFMILSNKSLQSIDKERPKNKDDFINIHGLSYGKYELCGKEIIDFINSVN